MFDGLFETQNVYLEDTLLGVMHDLRQSDYTFTTQIGSFDTRFVLRYTTESLGTENPALNENTVVVYKNGQVLHVETGEVVMDTVTIYDITGKTVLTGKILSEYTVIELANLSRGIYLMNVGKNLQTKTFKVIKE